MADRVVEEVVEALRSAVRALRAAEKALLQTTAPSDDPAPVSLPQSEGAPSIDPSEKALLDFLLSSVDEAKRYEEQDPQSFRVHFERVKSDLREAVYRGDMYQITPAGSGMVSFDNTEATKLYESCLKGMRSNSLHAPEIVHSHLDRAALKNWGDVDADNDVVIMRYETPGEIEAHLPEKYLSSLMDAARAQPGAVDRCRVALAERGVRWEVADSATGNIDCTLFVSGVSGKWAACLDVASVLRDLLNHISVIEVDYDAPHQGWWDAARSDHSVPSALLSIIRGKEPKVTCLRSEVSVLEKWAASLPGWYDSDDGSTPLMVRDAVSDDILY